MSSSPPKKSHGHPRHVGAGHFLFVFSSPSGGGKTELTRALCREDPLLSFSISVTTRPPRPKESHGIEYLFMTPEEFERQKQASAFAETASVFGHFYGSLHCTITDTLAQGRDVVFDIDWQGAEQLKKAYGPQVITIFIRPPSLEVLEERLRNRGSDAESVIQLRMSQAHKEMSQGAFYDYVIFNDVFEKALGDIQSIIRAHRLRQQVVQGERPCT